MCCGEPEKNPNGLYTGRRLKVRLSDVLLTAASSSFAVLDLVSLLVYFIELYRFFHFPTCPPDALRVSSPLPVD